MYHYQPDQKLSPQDRDYIIERLRTDTRRGVASLLAKQFDVSTQRISQLKLRHVQVPRPPSCEQKSVDCEEGWLSLEEASRHMHCTPDTIRKWIHSGKLEAKKFQKKGQWFAYRVKKTDLANLG